MSKDWREGENWRDGVAKFFGQDTASVISGRQPGLGMDTPQANIGDFIWGRSQGELTGAYQDYQGDVNKRQFKPAIEALDGTFTPGMTAGQYQKQLTGLQRKDTNKAFDASPQGKQLTHNMDLQSEQMKNQTQELANANSINQRTLALSERTASDNMTLAANQMELARLDNKFDRETASADRNLTLQLAQMDSQLADKRLAYDRETRSMDKRDRMIAQLMSSIGSLGGAFAL